MASGTYAVAVPIERAGSVVDAVVLIAEDACSPVAGLVFVAEHGMITESGGFIAYRAHVKSLSASVYATVASALADAADLTRGSRNALLAGWWWADVFGL